MAAGDLTVADVDGIVVLPSSDPERTLVSGETRAAKESEMMKRLNQGETTLELMGLSQWRGRV